MAGRIITLQRQARELGRLRSGYTDTSGPKARPVKSSTWIVTSHSEDYVRAAAELYGGKAEKWQPQGNGAEQWRVITDAVAIDAIMPPGDPLSQAYELWNRGGCARRCDGVTETLSDSPCVCRQEFGDDFHLMAKDKRCSETTRLSLILPPMPDIGVFRVETHGHYAANEIAATVDVIRGATGGEVMVPVRARIEPRTRVAEGKTKQFPVIVIELRGATAGQILSGQREFTEIGGTAPRQAIEATKDGVMDRQAYLDSAAGCPTMEDLTALLAEAKAAGLDDPELMAHFLAQRKRIEGGAQPAAAVQQEDPDLLWSMIVAAAPEDWTTDRLREDFQREVDCPPEKATPGDLRTYLQMLQQAAQVPA